MSIRRAEPPHADRRFLDVFMPYEVRLAQRRGMVQGTDEGISGRCMLGLYLVHVEPTTPDAAVETGSWGRLHAHVHELLIRAIRDSDIPCFLGDGEHFAVARDLDVDNAHVIAQRMLGLMTRSEALAAADVVITVGYVVYPFSAQPNLPPKEWTTLLELTRTLAARDRAQSRTSGYGLVAGPEAEAGMAETVLIPVALDNPTSMLDAGMLALQKITVLSGASPR